MPKRMLALICGLILSITAFAQQITVNGNVVDATGEPIIGATVRVAGQQGGVITDFEVTSTFKQTAVLPSRSATWAIRKLKWPLLRV